jgi:hypothetical protein
MRDIAKLLFGREGDILSRLFAPGESDEFSLAEQARRAGEWCGTTPGRRLGAGLDGFARGRGTRRPAGRGE